jgi:LysR family glycine cleavage system transcriptional activator
MSKFKNNLPQLDPLVAFEAAARLGSFKLASAELNITPSAVSQQIRTLETQLGDALFVRGHRSIALSARGEKFQNSVVIALRHLSNATEEMRIDRGKTQLVVTTDTAFAAHWLLPRIAEYQALFPDVAVKIVAADVKEDLLADGSHLSIVHGRGDWRGFATDPLFGEEVFPVCSPEYLAQRPEISNPDMLSEADLLDLDYEQWDWMNWSIWLTELGLPQPSGSRKLRLNSYTMLIDAAKRGLGVALVWRHLVNGDLAADGLVAPVLASVKTDFCYYLAAPYNGLQSEASTGFRDWIIAACKSQSGCD